VPFFVLFYNQNPMTYYKVIISYKGTQYFGWQSQPEEEKPTVQEAIQQVIKRVSKYQACTVIGASRTDAGVHAQGQVAKLTIPQEIAPDKLLLGMNSLLPKDIRILGCELCPAEFNPIQDSKMKEYHYYFSVNAIENPLLFDIVSHVSSDLDIQLMNEGAELFIGEHDFYNFSRRDSNAYTTNRTISVCDIRKINFAPFNSIIYAIRIVGEGFLKQMVRYMAGSLFELGQKNISLQDLHHYLHKHQAGKLSPAAKAKGLHLVEITY